MSGLKATVSMNIIGIYALFLTYFIGASRAEDLGYHYERYENKDCPGHNLRAFRTGKPISFDQCVEECNKKIECKSFTLSVTEEYCQLKTKACTNSELKTYSLSLTIHGIRITRMAPSLKKCNTMTEDHKHGEDNCFVNEECVSTGKRHSRHSSRCRCKDKYTRNTVTNNCTKVAVRDVDCFSGNGHRYVGKESKTKFGKPCIKWSDLTGETRDKYKESNFYEKDYNLAQNYCRNPYAHDTGKPWNGDVQPWCYYRVSDSAWDACDVDKCPAATDVKCFSGNGHEYVGKHSKTKYGKPCVKWSDMTGEARDKYKESNFYEKDYNLAQNYCRNPYAHDTGKPWNGDVQPWCYYRVSDSAWDACDVDKCP